MDTSTVSGMVLSSMPVGENDRRIILLTKELGKISAFARGARKQNSPLLAGTRAFATGSFTIYAGRNSYSIQQASILEYFDGLSRDMEGMSYACYFMELAEYFAQENAGEGDLLNLLYVSLKALENEKLENSLVQMILELRMFGISGEYPQIFQCSFCGKDVQKGFFSMSHAGIFCPECGGKCRDGQELSEAAVYAMQYILSAPIGKLYTFSLSNAVRKEVEGILKQWKNRYLERKFKSLSILEEMRRGL